VPPARAPQSPDEERSGRQLCQTFQLFHSCERQSGGAGSGGLPDKAGAYCKEQKELFGLVMVQVRRTPVVPLFAVFIWIKTGSQKDYLAVGLSVARRPPVVVANPMVGVLLCVSFL
jgi:hypothetical protein